MHTARTLRPLENMPIAGRNGKWGGGMSNWLSIVAGLGQTPAQRILDLGRGVLIVLGIIAFIVVAYLIFKGFALLVEMVWPIVIAVIVGLGLLLLGYILASQSLAAAGGILLGTMFFLYLFGAMAGIEPRDKYTREADRAEKTRMAESRAARRKAKRATRGYKPPAPN
jgi:uncharacterized membrane protein